MEKITDEHDLVMCPLGNDRFCTRGGILHIRHNRTSASDAAVASLAGKFTIKEV